MSDLRKFYHGTGSEQAKDILENGIRLDAGRADADFGLGFYLTEDRRQAWKWARKLHGDDPAVVSFYCDMSKLDGVFLEKRNEWNDYVYSNRDKLIDTHADTDYVSGPMADGWNVKTLARRARSGSLTKKQFLKAIGEPFGGQTAMKTSKAVDSLRFGVFDEDPGMKEEDEENDS